MNFDFKDLMAFGIFSKPKNGYRKTTLVYFNRYQVAILSI